MPKLGNDALLVIVPHEGLGGAHHAYADGGLGG